MPIYEFYCPDCHTVFNFFSRRVNTETRPACPRCNRPQLDRRVSLFAISRNRPEAGGDDMADLDEARLEQAMGALASEADSLDEENPRETGRFMRRLFDATGLNMGESMQEAIRRMEAGEDPDRIEDEMGDLLESDDPFAAGGRRGIGGRIKRMLPPSVDEALYEL
jgi:putative FmdB family regulatory protein